MMLTNIILAAERIMIGINVAAVVTPMGVRLYLHMVPMGTILMTTIGMPTVGIVTIILTKTTMIDILYSLLKVV